MILPHLSTFYIFSSEMHWEVSCLLKDQHVNATQTNEHGWISLIRPSNHQILCLLNMWIIMKKAVQAAQEPVWSSSALKVKVARSLTTSDISRLWNNFQVSFREAELPTNVFLLTNTGQLSPFSLYTINSSSLAYSRNVSLRGTEVTDYKTSRCKILDLKWP